MAELKPCPFCGGTATLRTTGGWSGIGCSTDKCPALLHALMFRTADEAATVWNRRSATLPSIPQGHKAMPLKALRKLGALIEAPWTDEAAPDVLRRIHRVWDEMHATRTNGVTARYTRKPEADKRISRGDEFAGDAWLDAETGETVYTVVGFDRNAQPTMIVKDGLAVPAGMLASQAPNITASQALEALTELEASARGDEPFNHFAAPVVRQFIEQTIADVREAFNYPERHAPAGSPAAPTSETTVGAAIPQPGQEKNHG